MHVKQRKVLQLLERRNGQKYSELFRNFEYEDKFPYHVKQLMKNGYVLKRDSLYYITPKGITYTTEFNTRTLDEIPKMTARVLMICKYNDRYLLNLKFEDDPTRDSIFILPGGGPVQNETLEECCMRLLKNKFKLPAQLVRNQLKYRSTIHYTNLTTKGTVLFDNICAVFDVALDEKPAVFKNWFTIDEIAKLKRRHPTIDLFILEDNKHKFNEIRFIDDYGFQEEDLI